MKRYIEKLELFAIIKDKFLDIIYLLVIPALLFLISSENNHFQAMRSHLFIPNIPRK